MLMLRAWSWILVGRQNPKVVEIEAQALIYT
jgi:hypothetical protein